MKYESDFRNVRRKASVSLGIGALFTMATAATFLFGPRAEGPLLLSASLTQNATNLMLVFSALSFVFFLGPVVFAFAPSLNDARDRVELLALGAVGVLGFVTTIGVITLFSRGRQLRRRGKLLLPELENTNAWTNGLTDSATSHTSSMQAQAAAAWRENGRTEYASVAAFAQLTIDLMALGAPPHLLADAQQDALDEIRHAQLCFSLAHSLDGRAMSPAPFPHAQSMRALPSTRTLALARLAIDSLIEGALLEGYSARIIARLGTRCEHTATVEVLKELAADEGRHSRHGWDVVEWCLLEGGAHVARALRGASLALPSEPKENQSFWAESKTTWNCKRSTGKRTVRRGP
jgi:hypothetical protein